MRDKVDLLKDEMTNRFEHLKRKWREGPCYWNFSWADFQWAATMVITRAVKVCNIIHKLHFMYKLRIDLKYFR